MGPLAFSLASLHQMVFHLGITRLRCADSPAGWLYVPCCQDPPFHCGTSFPLYFSAGGSFPVKVMNSDLFRSGVTIFMGDSSCPGPEVHLPYFFPRPVARIFLFLILMTGQLFVGVSFTQSPVPISPPSLLEPAPRPCQVPTHQGALRRELLLPSHLVS